MQRVGKKLQCTRFASAGSADQPQAADMVRFEQAA